MFCVASKQEPPANNDLENQAAVDLANKIVDKIRSVNRPIVIGDFYAQRFGFGEEMRGLCGALGIRYFGSEYSSVLGMFQGRDPDRRVIFFRSQSCQVSLPSQCQLRQRLVPWY
jgi:TPP-dependent 2-oxoacid decarboxylase